MSDTTKKLSIANEEIRELRNLLSHERDRRIQAEGAALTAAKMLAAAGLSREVIEACTGISLDH